MRVTCDVKVFGEDLQLPLTMEPWQALSAEGLCLIRLTLLASQKGEKVFLTVEQSARVLAIGLGAKNVKAKAWELYQRSRKDGAMSLITAATAYLADFASEANPEPEDRTAKPTEGSGPNP